jgi:pimeloyl-ACP methyl ester carboxylesterase
MTQRATIHFAHANGFPAGTYSKMFSLLERQYVVMAIEKLGHDPRYPVDDNWQGLVRELADHIESSAEKPVIGVGHSLGGILTFMAAYHKPQLFSKIIMLDPPLVYGPLTLPVFLAKKLRLIDRVRLVSQTRKRRARWSSQEEAEAYFKRIPLFRRFDPDCLRDYVQYGTIGVEKGVRLSFDVNIEASIFRTTPHNMTCLRERVGVPGAVIVGGNSYTANGMLRRFAKRHGLYLELLKDGSHLFPLEHPEQTAVLVMETIQKLEAS